MEANGVSGRSGIGVLDSLDLAGTWERQRVAQGRPKAQEADAQGQLLALLPSSLASRVPAPVRGGAGAHAGAVAWGEVGAGMGSGKGSQRPQVPRGEEGGGRKRERRLVIGTDLDHRGRVVHAASPAARAYGRPEDEANADHGLRAWDDRPMASLDVFRQAEQLASMSHLTGLLCASRFLRACVRACVRERGL